MNTWMPMNNASSIMVQDGQYQFMQPMNTFNPNHVEQLLSQYKQLQQQQQQSYIEQMKAANYAARKLCFNFLRGTCTLSKEECEYRHPNSQDEVDAERAKLGKIECRYGDDCVADNCLYKHNNKKFFMFSSNATNGQSTSSSLSSKSLNSNNSTASSITAMVSPTSASCSKQQQQPKRSSSPTFSAVSSISTSTSSLSRKDSMDSLSPSLSSNENDMDHFVNNINIDIAMQINNSEHDINNDDDISIDDELNAFASHLSLMKEISSQYNLSAIRDPQVKTLVSVLGNIDGLGIAEKIDIPQCVLESIETRPKIIDDSIASNIDYSKLFDMVNVKRTLSHVFDLHLQQTCNYTILVSQILDYANYHQLDYAWIMIPKGEKQEMELETILFDKNIDYMVGTSSNKPGQLGYLIRLI